MGEQAQSQPSSQSHTGHLDDDTAAAAATACSSSDGSFSQDLTATTDSGCNALRNPTSKLPCRPCKIRKLSPNKPSHPHVSTAVDRRPMAAASKAANKKIMPYRSPMQQRVAAKSLISEGEVEIALRHLRNADPHLAPLIDFYQPPSFDKLQTPFLALIKSILYQQLAYKAGTSIYARFVSLCGGEDSVVPSTLLALTPPQLRQIGVSVRKSSYLHDLARKYQNGILSDSAILEMDDKSLFRMLTMVNGIGTWSVHMFMIFSLHRPDVLPAGDIGVRKGVQILYGLEEFPRPSQMEQLCEKWRPYRSVAAWYLWRLIEGNGQPSGAAATDDGALQKQEEQQQQPLLIDQISSIHNLGAGTWEQ